MNKFVLYLSFVFLAYNGFAQTEFEKERKKMQQEFESFRKKTNIEFNNYRDSVTKDFENFKKLVWKEFQGFKIGGNFVKPKPRIIPPIKPNEIPLKPITVTPRIPKIITKPKITLPQDDFSKRISPNFKLKLQKIISTASQKIDIDFYGAVFHFYYNPIRFSLSNISRQGIISAVKQLSGNTANLQSEIDQWAVYAQAMQLNDYGFFQLVKKNKFKNVSQ